MHVRVCVECGEEYRPEIAVCADCGGRLEDQYDDRRAPRQGERPLPEAPSDLHDEFTEAILQEDTAGRLVAPADVLVEQGIPCRVRPSATRYALFVTSEDRLAALTALGLDASPGEAGSSRSCPACEAAVQAGALECPECGLVVGDEPEPDPSS